MQLITIAAIGAAALGLLVLRLFKTFREINDPRYGPGPLQIPFIGRIHDLPAKFMWLKFHEWAVQYAGDLGFYRTHMLGHDFIVISDEQTAFEILVKRGKTNSDRPVIRSLFDSKSTHGSMEYLPLMGRNQYWARQRKLVHSYLTETANSQYYGVLDFEVKRWLARLMVDPDDFKSSLEDMASKVMCTLCWDDTEHSAFLSKTAWGLLTQMSPAGVITNILTPLWHLPMIINPWKRAERIRHDEQQAFWMTRLLETRARMAAGEQRACWTKNFLERSDASKSQDKPTSHGGISGDNEASSVLGMLATVGIITIGGPLSYFLIAMANHPRWQAAVQREVDAVCAGRTGPPTLNDFAKLPVLRACIKETMRWKPTLPTGVAHEAEQDFVYKGVLVRKGARLMPLDWAFLRNPTKYPDPESFRPERWLEPGWPTFQEPLTQFPTIKGMSSFGWGQRQCLGMSLMQDELLISCGALAWCFNLVPKRDPITGEKITVPVDKSNSLLLIKPESFQMAFEPRSQGRKREVLKLWSEAEQADVAARKAFSEGKSGAELLILENLTKKEAEAEVEVEVVSTVIDACAYNRITQDKVKDAIVVKIRRAHGESSSEESE